MALEGTACCSLHLASLEVAAREDNSWPRRTREGMADSERAGSEQELLTMCAYCNKGMVRTVGCTSLLTTDEVCGVQSLCN